MENSNNKNENIETKNFNNMQRNQFLKVKNSLLELEKYFMELKDRELKDKEVKIKREIEEQFLKPIVVPIDNMDKFEQKEMKKIRSIKNTWCDCDSEPIKKGCFKDKVASLFKTNTSKQTKQTIRRIHN